METISKAYDGKNNNLIAIILAVQSHKVVD